LSQKRRFCVENAVFASCAPGLVRRRYIVGLDLPLTRLSAAEAVAG
jgi:hypothetical protein